MGGPAPSFRLFRSRASRKKPRDPHRQHKADDYDTDDAEHRGRRVEVPPSRDGDAGAEHGTHRKQHSEPPHGRPGARIAVVVEDAPCEQQRAQISHDPGRDKERAFVVPRVYVVTSPR